VTAVARFAAKDTVPRGRKNAGQPKPGAERRLAEWTDSTAAQPPGERYTSRGTTRRAGIPVPEPNPLWHPQAQSWFNSLKLSGQSELYEASDWATAVLCAQLYDIYMRSRAVNVLDRFLKLSARLGVTVADRYTARIVLDEPDETELHDDDEDAADDAVVAWHGRLGLVKDADG
jgi:hypothetical protein